MGESSTWREARGPQVRDSTHGESKKRCIKRKINKFVRNNKFVVFKNLYPGSDATSPLRVPFYQPIKVIVASGCRMYRTSLLLESK